MDTEAKERVISDFEKVRKQLLSHEGVKGVPYEREYTRLYDRLAMLGVNKRRRLRKKYRG